MSVIVRAKASILAVALLAAAKILSVRFIKRV